MNKTIRTQRSCPHRRVRGFTLLEVMIAIVVFSIGLLGVAGLQVAGMRFTQGSQLRAVAIMQAESIADRMRANMIAVYPSDGVATSTYNRASNAMPAAINKDCDDVACTSQELANFHLATWNLPRGNGSSRPPESNPDVLPQGDGVVCLDSTPEDGAPGAWACDNLGSVFAVKVTWMERTIGETDRADSDGDGDTEVTDTAFKRVVLRVVP